MSCLPLKDTTRSSILSKIVYSAWLTIPFLEIDQYSFLESSKTSKRRRSPQYFCKCVNTIFQKQQSITTSISRFNALVNFGVRGTTCHNYLNTWLKWVIDNDVKDLRLDNHLYFWTNEDAKLGRHMLPESIFHDKSIESLELFGCQINHATNGIGLCSLKKVRFQHVKFDQHTLSSMVSTFLQLEDLQISLREGFHILILSATNLKILDFYLSRDQLQIEVISAPNLKTLTLGGGCESAHRSLATSTNFQNLKKHPLHDLDIEDEFVEILARFNALDKLFLIQCGMVERVQLKNIGPLGCLSVIDCGRIEDNMLQCFMYNGVMYRHPQVVFNV